MTPLPLSFWNEDHNSINSYIIISSAVSDKEPHLPWICFFSCWCRQWRLIIAASLVSDLILYSNHSCIPPFLFILRPHTSRRPCTTTPLPYTSPDKRENIMSIHIENQRKINPNPVYISSLISIRILSPSQFRRPPPSNSPSTSPYPYTTNSPYIRKFQHFQHQNGSKSREDQ